MYDIDKEVEHRLGALYHGKQDANMTWYFKVEHDKITPPVECDNYYNGAGLMGRGLKVRTAYEYDINMFAELLDSNDTLYIPVYDDMASSTMTKDLQTKIVSSINELDHEKQKELSDANDTSYTTLKADNTDQPNIFNKQMGGMEFTYMSNHPEIALNSLGLSEIGYTFTYARSHHDLGVGLLNDHWTYNLNIIDYEKNACWFHHEIPAFKWDENPGKYKELVIKPFDTKQSKLVWRGADSGQPTESDTGLSLKIEDLCCNFSRTGMGSYNLFQLVNDYHLKSAHRRDIVKHYHQNPVPEIDVKFTDAGMYEWVRKPGHTCDTCRDIYMNSVITLEDESDNILENNCEDFLLQTIYNANTKHKYVINIPGNDYSSNQWWIHGTSCIVFYPDFQKSQTVFDAYLKPWYHYVPFNATDPGDILDKIKWCENNIEQCKSIVKNSNDLHATMIDANRRKQVFANMIPYIKNNLCI